MVDLKTGKPQLVNAGISQYQPSTEIKNFTAQCKKDYAVGYNILNRPFREFNDLSLLSRMDEDQKRWNSYVEAPSQNPDEVWRWNGVRPITRKKVVSIAAHMVSRVIYPNVFAQNKWDEEDRDAADIMRWQIEWEIRNSDYEMTFLFGVIAALVNPIAYLGIEFSESMQTIKEKAMNGEITLREVIDEVFSGMQIYNIPADEILIANAYQYYLQKQRFLWRRRFIDYDEAKTLHGTHKNFVYVSPGVKAIYSEEDAMFYDQKDDSLATLCEEATYYNRKEDTQVAFINGIYMGDDNVLANPMKHRDNENRPKYPFCKFGFEPIDEKRFYFYKSLVFKMVDDQELGDRLWRVAVDSSVLEAIPPIGATGGEKIDTNVMFPGQVTNFGREGSVTPIGTGRNLNPLFSALKATEESLEGSSQPELMRGGESPEKGKTAYQISREELNARIQMGLFGRILGQGVIDFGELLIDKIIHYRTIGEFQEKLEGGSFMKYRTFLLPEQTEGGKKVTRKMKYEPSMIGKAGTEEEELHQKFRLMEEEGGLNPDSRIYEVNPKEFARLKFKLTVGYDQLFPMSEEFEKSLKLEAYDRMIRNPYIEGEAVTRDFLVEPLAKGQSEKYIKKQPLQQLPMPAAVTKQGTPPLAEQALQKEKIPIA